MEELLKKIEAQETKRTAYAKKQFHMAVVTALCCAGMLAILAFAYLRLVPKLNTAVDSINVAAQNLVGVSEELAEADLDNLARHVDQMAVTSEQGVKDALEKIEAIDIAKLNQTIQDLSDAVAPFAKFMRTFQ